MTRHPVTDHAVASYFERFQGMTHLVDCHATPPTATAPWPAARCSA